MEAPRFAVRWQESNGIGRLLVSGYVAGRAVLRFDLRRPHGGPLLQLKVPVARAGAFRSVQRIPSRLFARGARLLPGGFVASLRGGGAGTYIPTQLRTVSLEGPRSGVVRRSYASAVAAGKTVGEFRAGTHVAWANFRFAQQPEGSLPLHVAWYWPNGRFLGSVRKGNTPTVSSYLRDARALPAGCWHADLYAGATRIKSQVVRIGARHC
jgi:hypothetical protein